MKLVQTQKTIEDAVAAAPLEDLEVLDAWRHYLYYQGIIKHSNAPYRWPVLSPSQIDLLLQNIHPRVWREASFLEGTSTYINTLINRSIRAGNDQFVLHTGDVQMNDLLREVGDSSTRSRITVHGNVGDYFGYRAHNVDVTLCGDCVDVGSNASDCSFEVHGNITYDAIFRSVSTSLVAYGNVRRSVASEAHHFKAEVHGAVGKWCCYRARQGVLTLHGSYGNHLGESAEHCTFKVKKEHYHGQIGLVSRLFRRNKVVFI